MAAVDKRKLVGVAPPEAFAARPRLLAALEAAHPVRFEPRPFGDSRGLDGAIVFRDETAAGELPQATCPNLVLDAAPGDRERATVVLSEDQLLDPVLRGKRLVDDGAEAARAPEASQSDDGRTVLARVARTAVWSVQEGPNAAFASTVAPAELREGEALRDLLRAGRWLSLLPVVHFLRRLGAPLAWTPPPLRASMMFDDPNLHWSSYGRLGFAELARHASRHGYHVSIAMVPLDGQLVHDSTGRLFRERRDIFSLVMHGNDHTRLELYRDMAPADRCALVAQALRRTHSFERRYAIHVDRVMSSPHGLSAEDAMSAMFRLGVEAFTADCPFPWAPPDTPPPGWPLAGWEAAQLLASGFPVLPRYLFSKPLDDLVLRAFLHQPLIVYGHQGTSLDLLAAVARTVNGLGEVRWSSLEAIARSNYVTRKEGATLRVRAYSRRLSIELPDDVEQVTVELPPAYGADGLTRLVCRGLDGAASSFTLPGADGAGWVVSPPVPVGGRRVELEIVPQAPVDPFDVPPPQPTPWPILRRVLTEGRDRLLPFLHQEV